MLKNGLNAEIKDKDGLTMLHHACMSGHIESAEYLLEQGVNARQCIQKISGQIAIYLI